MNTTAFRIISSFLFLVMTGMQAKAEEESQPIIATSGHLERLDNGVYQSRGEFRASSVAKSELELDVNIEQDPSAKPLKSGLIKTQFGFKIFEQDQCNLDYAMLLAQSNTYYLQILNKSNSGQSTHTECENNGYTTIYRNKLNIPIKQPIRLRLKQEKDGGYKVYVNGAMAYQGSTHTSGPIGLRSDSALVTFNIITKK